VRKLVAIVRLLALAAVAAVLGCRGASPALIATTGFAQGTTYSVQWWSAAPLDESEVSGAVDAELARIDALLSNYRSDSTLEVLNAARTTEPLEVPEELVQLLRVARTVHDASARCFDPTVRPLVRAWGFDGDEPHVPSDEDLAAAAAHVGLEKLVVVDDRHVRKLDPELEIDMASIGQGYTVARMAAVLEQHGVENFLAEIGGELAGRGSKPDGRPWRVGVENPEAPGDAAEALPLPPDRSTAVVTSGTYRHFFEAGGKTYGHIIDPRTARPVEHALVAVTVVGPDATLAAAWGTALLCVGPDEAMRTADRLGIAALLRVHVADHVDVRRTAQFEVDWPGVAD
jgi:thiamine biosynthesis lipoprotein